jgi:hypothetical protein
MIRSAPVHVWLPGKPEPVIAGEFCHDSSTRTGRFIYAADYLQAGHPALSPDLPLRSRHVSVISPGPVTRQLPKFHAKTRVDRNR